MSLSYFLQHHPFVSMAIFLGLMSVILLKFVDLIKLLAGLFIKKDFKLKTLKLSNEELNTLIKNLKDKTIDVGDLDEHEHYCCLYSWNKHYNDDRLNKIQLEYFKGKTNLDKIFIGEVSSEQIKIAFIEYIKWNKGDLRFIKQVEEQVDSMLERFFSEAGFDLTEKKSREFYYYLKEYDFILEVDKADNSILINVKMEAGKRAFQRQTYIETFRYRNFIPFFAGIITSIKAYVFTIILSSIPLLGSFIYWIMNISINEVFVIHPAFIPMGMFSTSTIISIIRIRAIKKLEIQFRDLAEDLFISIMKQNMTDPLLIY